MKALMLCDDGNVELTARLCHKYQAGIEIQALSDPKLLEREADAIPRHKTAIEGILLRSLHGCYGDLCPGSSDPLIREVTRNRFELSYWMAKQLQIEHIVFHHGYVPHTSRPAGWLRRTTEFWHSFLEGKDETVQFYIENHLDHEYQLLIDVIDSIGRPNVKINFDTGHAHFASKQPVTEWIEKMGTRIGYVHMHDNHGEEDEHLGFGQGTIPFRDVCDALNTFAKDAYWALEAKAAGLQVSLDWLKENRYIS